MDPTSYRSTRSGVSFLKICQSYPGEFVGHRPVDAVCGAWGVRLQAPD